MKSDSLNIEGAAAASRKGRVYVRTYGCQMNEYDSQKLYKILESDYDPAPGPESADLVLINTCSVRDKPEQKLYSMLGEMKEYKRGNPDLMIGVGGCVAQQEGAKIVKRSSVVDFVFGTHNLSLVPALIESRRQGLSPQVAVDYREEWEDLPLGLVDNNRVSVFVSISRGCNKNCTYCIVPTTRGPEASRSMDEILREVRLAAHRGAKEIVLLGQTVNSYGRDFSPKRTFVELLREVAAVESIERIRFTSPHPQEVREDFFDILAESPKICRHIHMPLQSGSNKILKLMNRNYRRERYLDIIQRMRDRHPDMAVTTDIIVGFPGETDEDYEATIDVMRQVCFDNSYSFMFSPRPGTAAANMDGKVSDEVSLERLQKLQRLQEEMSQERLKKWIGKEVEILLDGASQQDPKKLQGRISQNIMTSLSQAPEGLKVGMLLRAVVERTGRFSLVARALE